jgi:hypothetical protein
VERGIHRNAGDVEAGRRLVDDRRSAADDDATGQFERVELEFAGRASRGEIIDDSGRPTGRIDEDVNGLFRTEPRQYPAQCEINLLCAVAHRISRPAGAPRARRPRPGRVRPARGRGFPGSLQLFGEIPQPAPEANNKTAAINSGVG